MATKGKQATWSQKLSDEEVLWHVFSFKECFEYKELTERASSINIGESHISITESGLEKDMNRFRSIPLPILSRTYSFLRRRKQMFALKVKLSFT